MTLEEFKKSDMDKLYNKYKGRILTILHTDEILTVCEEIMFNSDLCFYQNTKTEYEVLKNKSLGSLVKKFQIGKNKRLGRLWGNITISELYKIISKCEEEGYLIVGKENLQ